MADFLSGLQQNFSGGGNSASGRLLNTGIDKDRNNFLTGLRTTSSGKKEDPTYLGFRLLFDFNPGKMIDNETFLPISPILCDSDRIDAVSGVDLFNMSKMLRVLEFDPENAYKRVSNPTKDFYYFSAKGYLSQRRSEAETGQRPGGGFSTNDTSNRANSLIGFKNILRGINEKSPWYIQSIDGLDELLAVPQNRSYTGNNYKEKTSRGGVLTFNCLDGIDLRVAAMADLYRKATYDYDNLRSVLPQNLRKFRMWIIVTEIRNIHLDRNALDVLNPFNIPIVSNLSTTVGNISQAAGFNNAPAGPPNASDPLASRDSIYENLAKMEPYIFMYQLDQCEFDFDEHSHIPKNLSNAGTREPVSNRFKIHVGKISEKKLQYNILSDLVQNKSQFSPILIADSWNLAGSMLGQDYDINNDGNLFATLANNFINNSISSVIQKASPVVSQAYLGNAYGFQINDITRLANSAQDLIAGVQNLQNPFKDAKPQSRGLGGPGERVYPSIEEDVYGNVKPSYFPPGIGNVYPGGTGYAVLPPTDIYGGVPGKDLGLPGRLYPTIKADDYPGAPGPDLGAPTRVYPEPTEDVYKDVEGSDLGLPDRVYPSIINDEYTGNPGPDLGAPTRVYPAPNEDVYPTVSGSDLGLPTRVYPINNSDEYPTVAGPDLGAPSRVYPAPTEDTYPSVNGVDLGLPDRMYPPIVLDEYPTVSGNDLGTPDRVYPAPTEDTYPTVDGVDLGLPDRMYPPITKDEYPGTPGPDLGVIGRAYPKTSEDIYMNEKQLYPKINTRVYPVSNPTTPADLEDVYPTVEGVDLGGEARVYPGINDNQYK